MIVREIMKKEVATCGPQDDLTTAVKAMNEHGCGFLPVVDSHGLVAGVVTDRDVSLHAAGTTRSMAHISASETMTHPVFSCLPDDNVKATLETMAQHHVRRLPVVDKQGHLQGVLSIDDVMQAPRSRGAPTTEEIVSAFKRISAPRRFEPVPE